MSEIKVNKISPRTACGTTTLGDSGDTFTIPAGVSITNNGTASGFGATGAASWNTTVKTGDFTAVSGEGYFVDTTSGAINVTLPAGTAGAVVAVKDYAKTFDTNNVTLVRNGSDKIGGVAVNATLSTEGLAVTLVFIDSTQGWLVTDSGLQDEAPTAQYIVASGGTPSTCGDFKIHTFTSPGTFTVSCAGNAQGNDQMEYLVVAGGGGAGGTAPTSVMSGAGGAGGFRFASPSIAPLCYPAKPLAAPAGLTAAAQAYPITVGAGGAGGSYCLPSPQNCGQQGSNSVFSTITSAGGGGGARYNQIAGNGGSGGGGAQYPSTPNNKGTGNTPPVSPPQGNPGGNGNANPSDGTTNSGGGGGGAAAAGSNGASEVGGAGGSGAGLPSAFGSNGEPCGSFRYYAGGGRGGNNSSSSPLAGAIGGGGNGMGNTGTQACGPGVANTGGGGGGVVSSPSTSPNKTGGVGGSGIVIIRYKFQN